MIFYFYITIMCNVSMDQVFKVYNWYTHLIPFCSTYMSISWVKQHNKNIRFNSFEWNPYNLVSHLAKNSNICSNKNLIMVVFSKVWKGHWFNDIVLIIILIIMSTKIKVISLTISFFHHWMWEQISVAVIQNLSNHMWDQLLWQWNNYYGTT